MRVDKSEISIEVRYTVKFETPDEIPRDVNLRMFDERLPDINADIIRHTPHPGIQRCTAEFRHWLHPPTTAAKPVNPTESDRS